MRFRQSISHIHSITITLSAESLISELKFETMITKSDFQRFNKLLIKPVPR